MFPGVDGFQWDAGHVIFLGAFFSVVTVVSVMFATAWLRSLGDRQPRREQAIRWHLDFSELPSTDRCCRHELTGETAHRQCLNEFDCRKCSEHPKFVHQRPVPTMAEVEMQTVVAGVAVPLDRLYHRGHTWARKEADGTFTVGLDAFASRLLGRAAKLNLPGAGSQVFANGTAFRVEADEDSYRVLSPVSGEVVETSQGEEGWLLKIRPEPGFRTDHLLSGADVKAWLTREFERLQIAMGPKNAPALADGGTLVEDLAAECPNLDWADVKARMLLNV